MTQRRQIQVGITAQDVHNLVQSIQAVQMNLQMNMMQAANNMTFTFPPARPKYPKVPSWIYYMGVGEG